MNHTKSFIVSLLLAVSLFLSGCGGGNNSDAPPSPTSTVDGGDSFVDNPNNPDVDANISIDPKYATYRNLQVYPISNVLITAAGQTAVLEAYLGNNAGLPVEGEDIVVEFFDSSKGTLTAFNATTNRDGRVAFNYVAPQDINIEDMNITMKLRGNTANSDSVMIDFNTVSSVKDYSNYQISLVSANKPITQSYQVETFDVYLSNTISGNPAPAIGDVITVDFFDGNSGTLNSFRAVTDATGKATFIYTAPLNIQNLDSISITFRVENTNLTAIADLREDYLPAAIDLFLDENETVLRQNSQIVSISMKVVDGDNNPYSDGTVKIKFPSDVRESRDIGSFAEINASIVSGKANFVYTAPSQLDVNQSNIVFEFYHESNIEGRKAYTLTINPNPDQIVLTSYELISNISDDNLTMGLEASKLVSFFVKEKNGVLVSDNNIANMRATILNPSMATLSSSDGNETNTTSLFLQSDGNSFTMNVNSQTISGVVPIKVDAEFTDVNNQVQTLSKVFNVIVISGPPSAISLSYAGTEPNDGTSASFTENWIVRVTDKYNNLVNSNPSVSMGMIAGYAQDSTLSGVGLNNYLYFGTDANATMSTADNTFRALSEVFEKVDDSTDTLVVFGNGFTYDVSGKWDFTYESNTTLSLVETFDGNSTSGLGFAVGNNIRQIPGDGGQEAIGNVYPKDNNYTIGDLGYMTVKVNYDYYLTGKSVVLWVNLVGYDLENSTTVRIGEAKKVTLRANGLEAAVRNTAAGEVGVVHRIPIKIKDSPEWYRNANFGFSIKTSDNLRVNSVTTSNGNLANNVAYVDVNVTEAGTPPAAGTIEILNALAADEF